MQCPSCRAPIAFRPGAGKVKVCEFCNTVVLRGDANLKSLYKVADLVDTESPLKLGLAGREGGVDFTVVGRLQKRNGSSQWDEWCLAYGDGREAWLSESEGQWHLMFQAAGELPANAARLKPLDVFMLGGKRFVAEEVAQATTVSAAGQLPRFNAQHTFVDGTGPSGVFASLDLTPESQEAFVGRRVTLAELGFDRGELEPRPRHEALTSARCPECNGPLDLKAPDATKRVACPYCAVLLDVSHGRLAFLQRLEKPPIDPVLPLGSTGRLNGVEWTVLAFLVRSCTVGGTRYPWDEYLLWHREKGFSWLMCSNQHWTHLTPLGAGEVLFGPTGCRYQGQAYKAYQSVFAVTDFVVGECYWEVAVGEVARASEYVAPPQSVNVDQTDSEASMTLGVYVPHETVRQAFGLKALPVPRGVAPAQVNPHRHSAAELAKWSALWLGCLLALVVAFAVTGDSRLLVQQRFEVPAGAAPASPEAQVFTEPFMVDKKVPLEVTVEAPSLVNNWLGVSVDLVNVTSGEVISVYAEPSAYAGVDDGESWSEGSRAVSSSTDAVEPGEYIVRATPSFDVNRASEYSVTVKADDGPGIFWPFLVFLLLVLIPVVALVRSNAFETERWVDAVTQQHPGDGYESDNDDD